MEHDIIIKLLLSFYTYTITLYEKEVENKLRCDNFSALFGACEIHKATSGQVTLESLDVLVFSSDSNGVAGDYLKKENQIDKDRRHTIIAATISYGYVVGVCEVMGLSLKKTRKDDKELQSKSIVLKKERDSNNVPNVNMYYQRLGDAYNECGATLIASSRKILAKSSDTFQDLPSEVVRTLLKSASSWLKESLKFFTQCNDACNIALVHANLAQCCKLCATPGITSISCAHDVGDSEVCLQEAVDHLSLAHDALGDREKFPSSYWDNISTELAATLLVLGVKRRQNVFKECSIIQRKLSEAQELAISKPMEQALKIYIDLGNVRQAAAARYQLALFQSKIWHLQRDETRTKEKLSNAFMHYISAYQYFRESEGDEPTFVVLCIDMSALYLSLPGTDGNFKALTCLLDTESAFCSEKCLTAAQNKLRGKGDKLW